MPALETPPLAAIPIDPAFGWLCALLVVMAVSLTSRINAGILAIVLAWVVGAAIAGLKPDAIFGAFPSSLFLTLLSVTLLFCAAEGNGTLGALTHRFVGVCGGIPALMPVVFFLIATLISAMGPGAIAATALVAPLAMSTGSIAKVPPVLMALLVSNGANAGSPSPFSAVGVIVQTQFANAGLPVAPRHIFFPNFVAHALATAVAFLMFGGLKLSKQPQPALREERAPFTRTHVLTMLVLTAWIAAVVFLGINLGLAAFAGTTILILAGAAEDSKTVKAAPWSVLLLVCGVSVLVEIGQDIGGIDLFTKLLATVASPGTANGMMALVTGIISTYSSTSGVVYPAFLPAVPGLVAQMGGGNALEIAMSINVGAALVDVSPPSTLGALCIAAAVPFGADAKRMFRTMLLWGFSMAIVGALFCQFFIRWFC